MQVKSFDEWMRRVDAELTRKVGMGHQDLADWAYYDAWTQGFTPAQAAKGALRDNGLVS